MAFQVCVNALAADRFACDKDGPGAHCNPVPIWDFTSWTHPGPPSVTRQRLCGQVRHNWLSRSNSHSGMQDPEAMSAQALAYGAVRVGQYVDAACRPAAPPPPPPDCTSTLDAATIATIAHAINVSTDANPLVKDLRIGGNSASRPCVVPTDASYVGVRVAVGGECWQHVHPDEYDVRDVTRFMTSHPGNSAVFMPVARFAERGESFLTYPASHAMTRWRSYASASWTPEVRTRGLPPGKGRAGAGAGAARCG